MYLNLLMVTFKAMLQKFGNKGEKTGWTYIDIPEKIAQKLKHSCKKSFRVKGEIDEYCIKGIALTPMGDGNFILAVNASIRKAIKKIEGAFVRVNIEEDTEEILSDAELLECLKDEPAAYDYFKKLPPSHQNWFSNWVNNARIQITKTKRMAIIVTACIQKMPFAEMIKMYREEKKIIQ